jgi:predicted nucleotide-binding protein
MTYMAVGKEPILKIPLPMAQDQLMAQIQAGKELMSAPRRTKADRDALLKRIKYWQDYNKTWLDVNIGGFIADRFTSRIFNDPNALQTLWANQYHYLDDEITQLQSIHDRLTFWAPQPQAAPTASQARPDAPIFIVHGSDTLRAEAVARAVERATSHDTIILREQASLGRTLIEKFEHHAAQVSYAIIILTPDDHGARTGNTATQPRGRQNVIFEMGYFFGLIGRRNVSVLLHPSVEKPSDTDGIVYIPFDDTGTWKTELFRELHHAGFDISRL